MKTKHILTALALPAIFAACTADDIVSENSSLQQERAKLSENFKLNVNGDGVESRYTVNNGVSSFNTGDKVVAYVVDDQVPGAPVKDWDIIPDWAAALPFTFNATTSEWLLPEGMGMNEGNHIFKFSRKNDIYRGAISYELPVIQNQYTTVGGSVDLDAAIEAGNISIGAATLNVEDEVALLQMKNIFTYPKFIIQFDNGEKVSTVSKVVMFVANSTDGADYGKPVEDGFVVKSGFKHESVMNLFNDPTTDWDAVSTNSLIYTAETEDDADNTTIENETYLIAQMPNNAAVKLNSNTSNKYAEVRFVLPAMAEYTDIQLGMYVYTDNGMYWIKDVQDYIQFKATTDLATRKEVLARNKNYNLTLQAVDEDELTTDAAMIVSNNNDWNSLVNVYGGVKNRTYDILIVGNEFGFDETTAMPSKAVFNVIGNATVKGEATLSNVNVSGTTFVAEDAKLTTSGSFTTALIENEGEVVFTKYVVNTIVQNYIGVTSVANMGTLTIAEGAIASTGLYNAFKAVVDNNGVLYVKDAKYENVNGVVENGNYGVINNYGEIRLTDDFTVQYQDVAPNNNNNNDNASFIYNEGEIYAEDGILTIATATKGDAEVVNKEGAMMTCKNSYGEIINNGQLTVEDGSITYITENNGVITVDNENPENLDIKDAAALGTIEYTASGKVSFENSLVNYVHVGGNLEIEENGEVASICFDSNASIKVPADVTYEEVIIKAGKTVTLNSNLTTNALTINRGAKLNVNTDKTLTINTGTYSNQGTIVVGRNASLIATEVLDTEKGEVNDNGTSNLIMFKSEKSALWNAAVADWAQQGNTNDGWYLYINGGHTQYYNGDPYDMDKFIETLKAWVKGNVHTDVIALYNAYEKDVEAIEDDKAYFEAAVTYFLNTDNVKNAAKTALYNTSSAFKHTWVQDNEAYDTKAKAVENMISVLNSKNSVNTIFAKDAAAAAYAYVDGTNIFNKLVAKNPYAYVWMADDCVLYEVIKFIVDNCPADTKGWKKLGFRYQYNVALSTLSLDDVKQFMSDAITYEGNAVAGNAAKALGEKYFATYKSWAYSNEQVNDVWGEYHN